MVVDLNALVIEITAPETDNSGDPPFADNPVEKLFGSNTNLILTSFSRTSEPAGPESVEKLVTNIICIG